MAGERLLRSLHLVEHHVAWERVELPGAVPVLAELEEARPGIDEPQHLLRVGPGIGLVEDDAAHEDRGWHDTRAD